MTKKSTERDSHYNNLEQMSSLDLLSNINREDQKVANIVGSCIPTISKLVDEIHVRMSKGGRLFYIGAGTSGRLGVVDASECPPTFGVADDRVIGLIAGGDKAIRKAVEMAEDNPNGAWEDLQAFNINELDTVIGIAASGRTPYVLGGLKMCNEHNILTGGITCNENSQLAKIAQFAIEAVVGPEFVTGSTRMKAGTAQKLILNMISTAVMVKLGHVVGNRMVDMQLSNKKLIERGSLMIQETLNISFEEAEKLLLKYGSVRNAIKSHG